MTKRFYNIKEISQYTSLPPKTLYEWAAIGRIPSIKIGRRVLFDIQDIDEVMVSMKRTTNKCETISNKIVGDIKNNVL